MTPGRRSRPPNHDPGGAGHGLERRNNVAERMPAERRAEQSEVCDDEALPPPPRGPAGGFAALGQGAGPDGDPAERSPLGEDEQRNRADVRREPDGTKWSL